MLIRFCVTKGENVRYLSHLEYTRAIERALRRTGLPVAYSEGFNPHMKLAFASALSVGVTSEAEYVDIALEREISTADFTEKMNKVLPDGICLIKAVFCDVKGKSLSAMSDASHYQICFVNDNFKMWHIDKAVEDFNSAEDIMFTRITPKMEKTFMVKQFLWQKLQCTETERGYKIDFFTKILPNGSIKPQEIWQILCKQFMPNESKKCANDFIYFHRAGLYKKIKEKFMPLI